MIITTCSHARNVNGYCIISVCTFALSHFLTVARVPDLVANKRGGETYAASKTGDTRERARLEVCAIKGHATRSVETRISDTKRTAWTAAQNGRHRRLSQGSDSEE